MSQDNVEVLRTVFGLWNAGDFDAISDHLDPSVRMESPLSSVIGKPYEGYAGYEQWRHDLFQQFDQWALTVDEAREIGPVVMAVGHIALQGRGSGVAFDQPVAWVVDFKDHRVTRLRVYLDQAEALRAIGLAE